jgi:plastocyanin
MSHKNKFYKNSLVSIAGILVIIVAMTSIHFPIDNAAQAQGQSASSQTNAITQVRVGGGNATYPFFGYNPQKVDISVGSKVVWTPASVDFAEPHTVSFILKNNTMAAPDAPFAVPSSTKFTPMPPGANSEPNKIPGTNTVIVNNARSYNPTIIDSTGIAKVVPPNAKLVVSGNEQYVNSGWLVPKTQEKAYPGSSNTFAVTFQKAGTYHYVCELHPWMVGQVVVK